MTINNHCCVNLEFHGINKLLEFIIGLRLHNFLVVVSVLSWCQVPVPPENVVVHGRAGTQSLVSSVDQLVLQVLGACSQSACEEPGRNPAERVEPVVGELEISHDANTGLYVEVALQTEDLGHGEPGVANPILLSTG